jgi:hypothetical protein
MRAAVARIAKLSAPTSERLWRHIYPTTQLHAYSLGLQNPQHMGEYVFFALGKGIQKIHWRGKKFGRIPVKKRSIWKRAILCSRLKNIYLMHDLYVVVNQK